MTYAKHLTISSLILLTTLGAACTLVQSGGDDDGDTAATGGASQSSADTGDEPTGGEAGAARKAGEVAGTETEDAASGK